MEHSFNIFPEIYLERREHATDPIEACTVTLARPIMTSLQDGHFTCLNHALMQQLGTIGQALYMRLFFHFANLYDGHHRSRLSFSKRYDDICAEWLGGLSVRKYPSNIEQEQLGPHLRQLVKAGFLASYSIDRSARAASGFVITFRPGAAFFTDYDRFYRQPASRRVFSSNFHADRQQIAEPLKVAYLFVEKRNGPRKRRHPLGVRPRTWRPPSTFWPTSRSRTSRIFSIMRSPRQEDPLRRADLGRAQAIPVPLPGTHAHSGPRQRQPRPGAKAEDKATKRRMDYDRFRRAEADRLFSSLPAKERRRDRGCRTRQGTPLWRGEVGPLAQTMFEIERARITAGRDIRQNSVA